MRRVDRAIFAIFLLALVADVARSYASTPAGSELSGSLILRAASHRMSGDASEAAFGRSGGQLTPERRSPRTVFAAPGFAAWSKALFRPAGQWSRVGFGPVTPVMLLEPAIAFAPQSAFAAESGEPSPFSPLASIERAGNPAP